MYLLTSTNIDRECWVLLLSGAKKLFREATALVRILALPLPTYMAWTMHLSSLCLCFPLIKLGIISEPTSQSYGRGYVVFFLGHKAYNPLSSKSPNGKQKQFQWVILCNSNSLFLSWSLNPCILAMGRYLGLNFVPQNVHWNPKLAHLKIWSFLEIGSFQM